MKPTSRICCSVIVASLFSACGGGGGSAAPEGPQAVVPPVVVPPVVAPVPPNDENRLQAATGEAPYAPGSNEGSAFAAINEARMAYGVGALRQNSRLDTAAGNHAQYVSKRWEARDFANAGHLEEAGKSGFTGITPYERMRFAGYAGARSGELLTTFISVDGVASNAGVVAVNLLLAGPYHRFGMLDGNRDVGIGDAAARFPGEGGLNHTVVINTAVEVTAKVQLPAASWVGLWPVDGATEVQYGFGSETPNPIPVNKGTCSGYPASVQVHGDLTLATTAFTMVETQSGTPVSVQLSTFATDVNPEQARANTAYIIPYKPLKLATRYTVHFIGTAGATAIDKSWSFTTGAANTKMIYGCHPS